MVSPFGSATFKGVWCHGRVHSLVRTLRAAHYCTSEKISRERYLFFWRLFLMYWPVIFNPNLLNTCEMTCQLSAATTHAYTCSFCNTGHDLSWSLNLRIEGETISSAQDVAHQRIQNLCSRFCKDSVMIRGLDLLKVFFQTRMPTPFESFIVSDSLEYESQR